MNKTEKALVKAIEEGNESKALDALSAFAELKSTSDEKANEYFEQIQSIGAEVAEEEAIIEEVVEAVEDNSEEEEVIEAPRVEKRGKKAKLESRVDIDKQFASLYSAAVNYFAEVKKSGTPEAKFAKRLSRSLHVISKTIMR